jgi:hypothetical protein
LTDYYLPAKADGTDFRQDVGVNYHENIGETVQPPSPNPKGVFCDGTLRACSTPKGAVWLAAVFANVRHFADCKFYRVTGTPVATLEIGDLGYIHGFTSLYVAQEYTTAQIKTLAGMRNDSIEIW